jgi:hypothetical protein
MDFSFSQDDNAASPLTPPSEGVASDILQALSLIEQAVTEARLPLSPGERGQG